MYVCIKNIYKDPEQQGKTLWTQKKVYKNCTKI